MRPGRSLRIAGSTLLALLLGLVSLTPFGQRFELEAGLASLYFLRGTVPPPDEAIVIGLDRGSIEWLELHANDLARAAPRLDRCISPHARAQLQSVRGVSGLPRGLHGCLIRALAERAARVIAFDILFRVPIPREDDAFAAEMARAGNVVLFERIRTDPPPAGGAPLPIRQSPRPIFAAAARGTAFFLLDAPSGNTVSGYIAALADIPERAMPEAVLRQFTGVAPSRPAEGAVRAIWLYGPARTIPTYSLRDVFAADAPHALPRDLSRVAVLVGASDPDRPGSKDHYKVPIAGAEARDIGGVELAATAFLNLLHGKELQRPAPPVRLGAVVGFALVLLLAASQLPGGWGLAAVLPLTGLYALLGWLLFARVPLWLPFAVPVYLGGPVAVLVALASRYAFARSLVARLAPRKVAALLLKGTDTLRHAAQAEPATVMFTDLAGSTRMADRLSELEYAGVLNRYYDAVNKAIEAHGGMVVEFQGDGVVALFSESVTGPAHATRACAAALALCAELPRALPPEAGDTATSRLRIGINTGTTATGEIGARDRFNYKALGDTVNVAARLEQHGRKLDDGSGDVILVSDDTRAASGLPGERFEPLGEVTLRGKAAPTGIARLLPAADRMVAREH